MVRMRDGKGVEALRTEDPKEKIICLLVYM
jgi:hypothetical protein